MRKKIKMLFRYNAARRFVARVWQRFCAWIMSPYHQVAARVDYSRKAKRGRKRRAIYAPGLNRGFAYPYWSRKHP